MLGLCRYGHRIDDIVVILCRSVTKIEECSELENPTSQIHIFCIYLAILKKIMKKRLLRLDFILHDAKCKGKLALNGK